MSGNNNTPFEIRVTEATKVLMTCAEEINRFAESTFAITYNAGGATVGQFMADPMPVLKNLADVALANREETIRLAVSAALLFKDAVNKAQVDKHIAKAEADLARMDKKLDLVEKSRPVGFGHVTDNGGHPCIKDGCTEHVGYDDEPFCFVHSPDSGSNIRGYSYKAEVDLANAKEVPSQIVEALSRLEAKRTRQEATMHFTAAADALRRIPGEVHADDDVVDAPGPGVKVDVEKLRAGVMAMNVSRERLEIFRQALFAEVDRARTASKALPRDESACSLFGLLLDIAGDDRNNPEVTRFSTSEAVTERIEEMVDRVHWLTDLNTEEAFVVQDRLLAALGILHVRTIDPGTFDGNAHIEGVDPAPLPMIPTDAQAASATNADEYW
jgi:hypothetical protein